MKHDPMRIEDSLTREYCDRAEKMRALNERGELTDPALARALDLIDWGWMALILVSAVACVALLVG